MNMQAKLMIAALGLTALPMVQAVEFEDFGRVVRVQPRVEQVRMPRQECRTEYVQAPVQQYPQQRSAGGSIIGGLAGALLGNQVGGGTGRVAATAAGAIAGAVVGDRVDNDGRNVNQPQQIQEQAVRQCRNVDASLQGPFNRPRPCRSRHYQLRPAKNRSLFAQQTPIEQRRLAAAARPPYSEPFALRARGAIG